jgi:hypothetical protein
MYKLVFVNKDTKDLKSELDYLSLSDAKNNELPNPNEKSSFSKFINKFMNYPLLYRDYKQVYIDSKFRSVKLFYFQDEAYALVDVSTTSIGVQAVEDLEIYRIGCNHDYEASGRMFYTEYECKICNYTYSIDSSD